MSSSVTAIDHDVAARAFEAAAAHSFDSVMITEEVHDTAPEHGANGDAHKIVFVNEAFTKMTGFTPEEVIGKTPRILQGLKTNQKVLDDLRHNLATGEVFHGKTINYRKNGTEFMIEWKVLPVRDEDGTVTHHVAVQRDVTPDLKPEAWF